MSSAVIQASSSPSIHFLPSAEMQPKVSFAGKHALIVEDNPLNAEILATLLSTYQVGITIIETPQALDSTLSELAQLDVLFLDLEFKDADGFEAIRQLKHDARLKGVPIVAYTIHTSEMDRARREGFHSFLGKPLKPEKFGTQLAHILQHHPVWDAY